MEGARRIVAGVEAAGVTLAAPVPDTWIGKPDEIGLRFASRMAESGP
jgi:hypothetical protein